MVKNIKGGENMTIQATVMELVKKNKGVITAKEISEKSISPGIISYLVKKGSLVHSSRGIYTLPNVIEDDFLNLQVRFKRGIFSNETALFLWNLTDRTPNIYNMTFPTNYNLTNIYKKGVKPNQIKASLYEQGITTVNSPMGNNIKCYSKERTLCDILRPKNAVDIQIVVDAFKRYVKEKERNIPELSFFAKQLGVQEKVRSYLEVLL